MRKTLPIVAVVAVTFAGSAIARDVQPDPAGEAKLAKLLAGRIAGKPVDCIQLHDIRSTEVVDRTAIVYQIGGTLYVNRPDIGPDALDSDDILLTKTPTDQLCRIDSVRLVDRTSLFERGFVGLGNFVPYTKSDAK